MNDHVGPGGIQSMHDLGEANTQGHPTAFVPQSCESFFDREDGLPDSNERFPPGRAMEILGFVMKNDDVQASHRGYSAKGVIGSKAGRIRGTNGTIVARANRAAASTTSTPFTPAFVETALMAR